MNTAMPPGWADAVLRILLAPQDRQTVSGDLLEEYRERIQPARGRRRADLWYVRQVAGFAWRGNRTWAGLLGSAFVARTALDWLLPTSNFPRAVGCSRRVARHARQARWGTIRRFAPHSQ